MAENSKIQWTDHTFNPWSGCTKVSPGCTNCYAEDLRKRWGHDEWGPGKPRNRTSDANWKLPIKWDRAAAKADERHRVFCASLADWLDPEVPIHWVDDLLWLIASTPNLDWLLLTKRPELWRTRMESVVSLARWNQSDGPFGCDVAARWLEGDAPENVWLGTTVEDQRRADERIPALLQIPARVHFLSCEPLLESIDLSSSAGGVRWLGGQRGCDGAHHGIGTVDCPKERHHHHDDACKKGVDWVIVGGESGPKARPFHVGWAGQLIRQCKAAGVACFVKQLGAKPFDTMHGGDVWPDQRLDLKLRHSHGGDPAEWWPELRVRQFPTVGGDQ